MGKIPTITLDGTVYELDVPNAENNPESYRQKAIQEQFVDEERVLFWKSWTMRSWHEGERLERILGEEDLKAFRYHDAEGVDTALLAKWGEAKLTPSLVRNLTVTVANLPMTVTSDGTTLILGLTSTPFIKKWTVAAGWVDTTAIAGSGAVTDLITAGSTLYAVRGGAVLTSTNAGANWTAVGSYTTATGVSWVNGELYVGKSDGVYNHTTSEAVTTEGCTVIAGYKENIYYGKDSRIYRYDGRAAYLYDQLPNGFNVTALIPYRMVLLVLGYYKVRSGYRGAVYYIVSGSENHLYSLGDYSADHRIYACCGSDDEIFFANPKRGGADRYGLEVGGLTGAPTWAAVGNIPFKSMAVCEGYLWVGRYALAVPTANLLPYILATTDTAITGWETVASSTVSLDTGNAHTGAGALKVVAPASGSGATSSAASIPAVAGQAYSWQGQMKTSTTLDVKVQLVWNNAAGTPIGVSDSPTISLTSSYALKKLENITAPALSVSVRLVIVTTAAEGTFWVDNQMFQTGATATEWVAPATDNNGIYQADIANPTSYKTTGWLTTPEYDFDWANEVKLFRDIRIEHRALLAGQSITVWYSLDGGTTYVQAGISNEIGTTHASCSLANVTANSIKLKFVLASGGTDTPTLTKCVVRAAPMSDVKFKWNIRILTLRKWGGADNVKALEVAAKKKSQLTFVDVDGEMNQIVIDAYLVSSKPDPQRDYNVVYMTLREV